ncbi:MAG: FAD:protein FMN transferase [Acidobacteria bacterium]|uniref:FAD:protein FMN transferase n=1 Tax=Candidatus Polarisedimenticola svalbardensis TaxID=2886004 RepID=A0A8J7CKX1_9BACT|nr:FAD:protein FMN transferase [Candidatus Polarisedimenticola svalbardensis]
MKPSVMFACLVILFVACSDPVRLERRWTVMGTYAEAEINAFDAKSAENMMEKVRSAFERVDSEMSNWKKDSLLNQVNRDARKGPVKVPSADLYRCIRLAYEYAKNTDGAFDPTVGRLVQAYGFRPVRPRVPGEDELATALGHSGWEKLRVFPESMSVSYLDSRLEVDLGGIAKGYAVDVAARNFALPGVRSGLMDLGGTVYAWGVPEEGAEWQVGIRDPELPDGSMGTILLQNRAVATSAIYENSFTVDGVTYGHILDPRTGRPAETDIIAASVISDSAAEADALSTAFFVAGSQESATMLQRARRIEAILLVRGDEGPVLIVSASLRNRFTVDPGFASRIDGRVRFILPPTALD